MKSTVSFKRCRREEWKDAPSYDVFSYKKYTGFCLGTLMYYDGDKTPVFVVGLEDYDYSVNDLRVIADKLVDFQKEVEAEI